ncbi:glycosyltransferase family 2 protein [Pedobacter faecalis]|uniref:glycosyltransferase family 2 protein n=1 Tax=Pedobacter faecalis TaxID=3041495 RepID=UPI0025517075|nr:glycosyltransferase family 2 protein [Pedobacter sp. ELA7]
MKVSIVTPVLNCVEFIGFAIASVKAQNHPHMEHIIIDGGSTDGTIGLVHSLAGSDIKFISRADSSMYEAINYGLDVAEGDVIGILNADDFYASPDIISTVVKTIRDTGVLAVYGNLNVVCRRDPVRITRKWTSSRFQFGRMRRGWMPPHPTVFIQRRLIGSGARYSLNCGSSADYDFLLRLFLNIQPAPAYVDKLFVCMRNGGISNGSMKKAYHSLMNDYKIIRRNGLKMPFAICLVKRLRKLDQFLIMD